VDEEGKNDEMTREGSGDDKVNQTTKSLVQMTGNGGVSSQNTRGTVRLLCRSTRWALERALHSISRLRR
jgi:hypothetical protein